MKVFLAGYNIDTDVLRELTKENPREDATPEVFSAAYARISRDPRSIEEIRKSAREEVEKTRKSNSTIIFKMGHHSVAEHAVFNFDIIGLSRYGMEALENFRLCSYTEKSQRYITLEDDFVIPSEIKGTDLEDAFVRMIRDQNAMYHKLYAKLKTYVFEQNSELAANPKNENLLEGWAKEDARYITSLATEAQAGLTVNARNLELMLRRFASHPLAEIRELGSSIYAQVKDVAPSIILFHDANDFDQKTYPELNTLISEMGIEQKVSREYDGGSVSLVHYDADGDLHIAASLLSVASTLSYDECYAKVVSMTAEERKAIFKESNKYLQLYDSLVREYEFASLTYDMVISSACFGQLKRHRMSTISTQRYKPELGVTIPKAIKAIGMEVDFRDIVRKTNAVYEKVYARFPRVAPYILTNAHQKRVLIRTNVRELYHMSRLREDAHAQWDIREKTALMSHKAHAVMPLACMLLGGKDSFSRVYTEVYGVPPRVKEAVLPGRRNIEA